MSFIPRLFVHSDLVRDGYAAVDEAQGKYLTRVLRLIEGAPVRVFNGRDGEWDAVIDTVEGRSVLLKLKDLRRSQAATPDLILLFAPLKKTRTDFVVEKATELGVSVIQPVMTERTQAARVRADRLQKIALEAAEQTERLDLPVVHEGKDLMAALEELPTECPLWFCDEAGDDPAAHWGGAEGHAPQMLETLKSHTAPRGAILVGPEGGFSPAERETLRARADVHPVSLGPRILRAETAAIAALTLWQSVLGDWRD
ncbi:MAG: 16S rRNA (uracil(1498)-N(3))-methyltransferase [Hyphomonadaceae bacterium]|nr:16S rRNA (uracil(1498)-N(3))-methyltransferase [Hyphomonadaceae bacterium]